MNNLYNVEDIRNMFVYKYLNDRTEKCSYHGDRKRITLHGAYFKVTEPYIFRKPSGDYIQREIDWYNSMSLNVNDIKAPIPKIWTMISDKDGLINSNYGTLMFSSEFGSQFESCKLALQNDPMSNHGIIITTRPSIHQEWNKNGMHDFICLQTVQFFIKGRVMKVFVNFRSNDAIFGFRNDYAWIEYITRKLMFDLNAYYKENGMPIELTEFTVDWFAGTLHIYEEQFSDIQDYIDSRGNLTEERIRQMQYELEAEYLNSKNRKP